VSTLLPTFLEVSTLLAIWLLASGLTAPLRTRSHADAARSGFFAIPLGILRHAARPLAVILISELTILALSFWAPAWSWIAANSNQVAAWRIFWLCAAVIAGFEGGLVAFFRWRRRSFPIPDLLMDIMRAVAVLSAFLFVLRVQLGIDIKPLLASTALLTAVVGFALQGVLGNLLSGMSLHLVHSLKPGVWIAVDGIEGKVIRTNWRETRIRTRGGHVHIIPNGHLAAAIINNMSEPTPLRRHVIEVGASYSDAPDEVLQALLAATRDLPEVRSSPPPEAMISGFLDFGINYRLEFWSTEYQRHNPIEGVVSRHIWYQFKRRGIEIPFPMSDKLLNDFMAVVYKQRRLPPEPADLSRTVADLAASDLCRALVTDAAGRSLLGEEELRALAPLIRRQPYTHGETLCAQGDTAQTFWVVARGRLGGEVRQGGEVVVTFELPPGSVVGEMSALTGVPRSATIRVLESTELLEFGAEAFARLLSLDEQIPERLSALAAERAAANRAALDALAERRREEGAEVVLERAGILQRLLRLVG
jgi:small-conductance mechanosensitive channel/CRP-like cAMP-binding protein